MKRVSIQKTYEQNQGQLRLGNGYLFYFSSKKKFNKFVADTNRFLTRKVIELNDFYARLYQLFRSYWPYYSKSARSASLYQITHHYNKASDSLDAVAQMLDQCIQRSSKRDGNMWAFIDVQKIADELKGVCFALKWMAGKRSDHHSKMLLTSYVEHLNSIINAVRDYGQESADDYNPSATARVKDIDNISNTA